jgi:hypothetical protein
MIANNFESQNRFHFIIKKEFSKIKPDPWIGSSTNQSTYEELRGNLSDYFLDK